MGNLYILYGSSHWSSTAFGLALSSERRVQAAALVIRRHNIETQKAKFRSRTHTCTFSSPLEYLTRRWVKFL